MWQSARSGRDLAPATMQLEKGIQPLDTLGKAALALKFIILVFGALETAWLLRDRSPSRVPRRQDSQVSTTKV